MHEFCLVNAFICDFIWLNDSLPSAERFVWDKSQGYVFDKKLSNPTRNDARILASRYRRATRSARHHHGGQRIPSISLLSKVEFAFQRIVKRPQLHVALDAWHQGAATNGIGTCSKVYFDHGRLHLRRVVQHELSIPWEQNCWTYLSSFEMVSHHTSQYHRWDMTYERAQEEDPRVRQVLFNGQRKQHCILA